MLSYFRRFSKSPFGIAIFGLILIAFIVTLYQGKAGIGGFTGGTGGAVATVGGEAIDENELVRRAQNQLEGQRQQNPGATMAQFVAAGGVEQTVDLTTTGRALEIFAKQQGMAASRKLIDGAIASMPAFYGPTGKFDRSTFLAALSARKVTENMLRQDFERAELSRALAIPASGGARVPAAMVRPYASLLLETRSGIVAAVPSTLFLASTPPTDAELQIFYQRNIARYTVPERRILRYASFDRSRFTGKVSASDAEITKYYNDNAAIYAASERRSFTQVITGSQAEAERVIAAVRGGTSLADAARSVQRDPIPIATTDLDGLAKLSSVDVARAAFAAPKGTFAAVKRSGLGYHVVRVDGVTTIPATPLATARPAIAIILNSAKQAKAMSDMVAGIEDAISNKATLDQIAGKFGLSLVATPPLTSGGAAVDVPGYVAPPEVSTVLRDAFQAEAGDDPAVATLADGKSFALWKLDRIVAAAPKPLAAVRDQVTADVRLEKASKTAKTAADAVVAALNGGMPVPQALAKAGVALPAPQPARARRMDIARAQGKVPPPLTLLFQLPEKRARSLELPDHAGWYVVYLDAIVQGDAKEVPGLIEATQQQLSAIIGDEYVQQFANAIGKSVGVVKNAAAIQRLKASLSGGNAQ